MPALMPAAMRYRAGAAPRAFGAPKRALPLPGATPLCAVAYNPDLDTHVYYELYLSPWISYVYTTALMHHKGVYTPSTSTQWPRQLLQHLPLIHHHFDAWQGGVRGCELQQ